MLPSRKILVLSLTTFSVALDLYFPRQGRFFASAGWTNFALHRGITATSTCGVGRPDAFCLLDNYTKCEDCNITCPFGQVFPYRFVNLIAEGNLHGASLVNSSCTDGVEANDSAIRFSTASSNVSVPADAVIYEEWTFITWIKQKSGNRGYVFSKTNKNTSQLRLLADDSVRELTLKFRNANTNVTTTLVRAVNISLSDNRCHHVAVTCYGSSVHVFVDGEFVGRESSDGDLECSGVLLLGGGHDSNESFFYEGEMTSPRFYHGALLPSEISELSGKATRNPRIRPECRCPLAYPSLSLDDDTSCVNLETNKTMSRLNNKSHFPAHGNDGDLNTWWQSRNGDAPVNISVSLGGVKQVFLVEIVFKSPPPKAMVLLKSADNGTTWVPLQYFAQNCQEMFNMKSLGQLDDAEVINCDERFSNSIAGQTVRYYLLEDSRPGSRDFQGSSALQKWALASHLRLHVTSFHGNVSEKTAYIAVSEISVFGRECKSPNSKNISSCSCNGTLIRPEFIREIFFNNDFYETSVMLETPQGADVLQVYAHGSRSDSSHIVYSIIDGNIDYAFGIDNITGVLRTISPLSKNTTYNLLILAEEENSVPSVNATASVIIRISHLKNLNNRTKINFQVQGLGFIQDLSKMTESTFGFFINNRPGFEGRLIASVGSVSTRVTFNVIPTPAVSVKAVMVDGEVWHDRPVVRVLAQVQDSAHSVRTLVEKSHVVFRVTPSGELAKLNCGNVPQITAAPSPTNGLCEVEIPLPSCWFTDSSLTGPQKVTVNYGLVHSNTNLPLATVIVHPESKVKLYQDDVYAIIPPRPIDLGATFRFHVYVDSSHGVASFGLKLSTSSCLEIVGVDVDHSKWLHVAANHSSTLWAVSGTLSNPETAPMGSVKRGKLISFDVKVNDSATEGSNATLQLEVTYLSNINNEEVRTINGEPLPTSAAIIDGFNEARDTVGTIRIRVNYVMALLPFAEPSELVNTAALDGKEVGTRINLLAVKASGEKIVLQSATCLSHSLAIHVENDCSKVWLDGNEPGGSAEAIIQVLYENITANVSIRVWYPVFPVTLSADNPELGEVVGWSIFDGMRSKCVQKYQWTRIQALVKFSYDDLKFVEISANDLVSTLLKSSDDTLAYVTDDGEVFGKSPGRVKVTVLHPFTNNVIGSVNVTVGDGRRVHVHSLDIAMVTNLSVSLAPSPYDKESTQVATAVVGQDINRDLSRSCIVVYATFSDGTRQQLSIQYGLRLSSINNQVLHVDGNKSEALTVGSGSGGLKAEWYLPESVCYPKGFLLGVGYDAIEVDLSPPVRVDITNVSSRITIPDDKSTTAGIPTSSPIKIVLLFQSGHSTDMTADDRTILDESESEGFFNIRRDDKNRPIIYGNSERKFGKKNLIVRFSHFDITSFVEVNVVQYLALALHIKPFPPYPGSGGVFLKTLNPIGGTDKYEMASLCLRMIMSDQSDYDVTYHNLAQFSSHSDDLIVGEKAPNLVSVKSAIPGKTYYVQGEYEGLKDLHEIQIGNTPVHVAAIENLSLTPENNLTLTSVQDTQAAKVTFSLLFDNEKQVLDFYQGGVALFPGLISIASENEQVFYVNSNTGQVTLRNNHYRKLTLSVTAAVSKVSAQIKVACNLKPDVLDIDLGAESGIPLAPQLVGKQFEVPVRLNAGHGKGTTKMDLSIFYDRRYLSATSVKVRDVWSNVVKNLNAGQISINGVCDRGPLQGTLEVAVITFNTKEPGLAIIAGSLTTDRSANQLIVSGVLQVEVVPGGARRRRNAYLKDNPFRDVLTQRRRRSSPCSTPSGKCKKCDGIQTLGDLNGDCIFDISDVLFILNNYTRSLLNLPNLDVAEQVMASVGLDVDHNAMVNPADAYFLVRANLDLVRFVLTTAVRPVQDSNSDCKLSLNVTMATKNGPAKPVDTFVFFDVTYRGEPVEFAGSNAVFRGPGKYGNVVRATSKGDGLFTVIASIELLQTTVGVSIYQVTASADNRTSTVRSFSLFGSSVEPSKLPITLQVLGKDIPVHPSSFNPFIVFNNTLASSACRNDFGPVFVKEMNFAEVAENVADNTTVAFVNATDKDSGKSGEVIYSLLSENVPFAIDTRTGRIYTNGSLDREQRVSYSLTVRATDRALGRARYAHTHVAVLVTDTNDNPPVITDVIPNDIVEVPENAEIGIVLVRVIASDLDVHKNGEIQFKLSSPTDKFLINSTSGELTLNSLLHSRVGQTFVLDVVVLDKGIPALNSSISIVLHVIYASDVDVLLPTASSCGNVTENSPLNTTVLQLTAHVPGLPQAVVQYFISEDTPFVIGAFDGIIRVKSNIDREQTPYINLTVHALYGGNITSNETLICIEVKDVNDVRPSFERSVYTLELDEGSSPSLVLYKLVADDLDEGSNAELTYSIISGNESVFSINRTSGEFSVTAEVDYESVQQLNFTVQAKDHGEPSLETNVSVIVKIRDMNDNYPVFEHVRNLSVREDASIGSYIETVNATDSDSGMNAKLAYSITEGNTGNAFFINATTGVIKTASTLDYEENKVFALEISARDHGSPFRTSTTVVRVEILDVNDVIPVIRSSSRVYVRENTGVGTVIMRLNASDADSGKNALLKFSIVEGNEEGRFLLNSTSGIVTLSGSLDHESASEHTLTVNVSDSGSPPLSSTTAVRIYVVDVNDHRPIFEQELYEVRIFENISVGSSFLRVSAFDLDSSSDEGISFRIVAGNANNTFAMNASTGEVTILKSLDFESIQSYHVVVEARDTFVVNDSVDSVGSENANRSSVSFFSYVNMTISIMDVNDNAPDFSSSEYVVAINENLPSGVFILRVHATDRDTAENGAVVYNFTPNDGFSVFAINESSGVITTRSSLRDANYLNYSLLLRVTDKGLPPLEGTSKVYIRIWYNVTFQGDKTDLFSFSFGGVLAFGQPDFLSRETVHLNLGLSYETLGFLVTRVGQLQQVKRFTYARQQATTARVILLSDWSGYGKVRLAAQVFDNFHDAQTSTEHVYFELRNLNTNKRVLFSCTPSAVSGICIASASVPEHWLNHTVTNNTVGIRYGFSSPNVFLSNSFSLTKRRQPEVKENFLIAAPTYLLHVGSTFTLQGYGQFEEPIASYTLLCGISGGLEIIEVRGTEGWTVYLERNGPTEFAIFGRRNNLNGLTYEDAATMLYFTLTMSVTEVFLGKSEEFKCFVDYVGNVGGNTIIPKHKSQRQRTVIWDRFGGSTVGHLVVVKDEVKALFAYADRSVLVNTAILNGRQIEVNLYVRKVSVQGNVMNASNPNCHSTARDVLKVALNCSKVFLDGTETSGSQEAVIIVGENNMTANVSFTVWRPITPLRLSVSIRELNKVKNWFDPMHSCRPRYQHSRLRAFANFTNGRLTKQDADVTHLILQRIRSHNISIAEVVDGVIEGRSKGKTTIDVYIPEVGKVLGGTVVIVTDEVVRVYVVDTFVATLLSFQWPTFLYKNSSYMVSAQAKETFLSPLEEGSVVVSLQYSDGEVNTFDNLEGFLINPVNDSIISVQSGKVTAFLRSGRGNHLAVTVLSGNCTDEYSGFGLGPVDVSFVEPIEITAVVSSKYLTYLGNPAETLGIPLFVLGKVFLLYNISGEVKRLDISSDTSTIVNITNGYALVDLSVKAEGIFIKASGNTPGKVQVSIGHLHIKQTTSITLEVLGADKLKLVANPYPSFNKSERINITRLYPVGTSGGHQKILLKLLVVLSNGSEVDVSRDDKANVSTNSSQPMELAQKVLIRRLLDDRYVLQITQFLYPGSVRIYGTFAGLFSQTLSLRIETTPLAITSVRIVLPSNFTLKGIQGKGTLQLNVDVQFSDGTMLLGMFSKQNENLMNLITFTTQATEIVSLNSANGLLTLKDNSFREVTVTAVAVSSSVTHSTHLACNLHPDVGDVDIGDVIGVPLKSRSIGETFTADLWINAGTASLGCLDVELKFQPELLEMVKVEKGRDMTGLMLSNIIVGGGKVQIAGALYITGAKSSPLHFATLTIKATSSGIAHLTGKILMMAEDNVQGTQIGLPLPRDIVAGNVKIEITEKEGRSRRSGGERKELLSRQKRSLPISCSTPPCSVCPSGREQGDADGNCAFDIRDIQFTLAYIAEKQFNFSRSKGREIQRTIIPEQLRALDADGDGVVSVNDADRLLKARLNLISLFPSVEVVPVQDPRSRCLLSISVPADDLGVQPRDNEQTRVYFQVSQSEKNFSLQLQKSRVLVGEHFARKNSGILLAQFNNISNSFVVVLNTSIVLPGIGVSVIKVELRGGGLDQSNVFFGQFSDPPLYPAELNLNLDVGNGQKYSVKRLRGYNPLITFNNTLASLDCTEEPLLERTLSDLQVLDARTIFVSWAIGNLRKGLNFTFVLAVVECDLLRINEPCRSFRVDVSGDNHTLTNLRPYSNYSVNIETKSLPLRSTTWETVRTGEAAPEGVNVPTVQILNHVSINIVWSIPERPNGVITSYSLYMNNGTGYHLVYHGVNLTCDLTGLTAGNTYRFYLVANTSAGGRSSEEVTVEIPSQKRSPEISGKRTAFPPAASVAIALGAAFVILISIVLLLKLKGYREDRKLEKYKKAYHFLDKYNYVDGRENVQLRAKAPVRLQKALHLKGNVYDIQELSVDGLQSTWANNHDNEGFIDDKWQDDLSSADINQRPDYRGASNHDALVTQTQMSVQEQKGTWDHMMQGNNHSTLPMTKDALDGYFGQNELNQRALIGTQVEREHFAEVESMLQVTKL